MKEITAFKPDCCNKAMLTKSSALRHERKCPKNPANKSCPTCRYYSETEETVYNPFHYGDPGSTDYEVMVRWCDFDEDDPVKLTGENEFNGWERKDCPNWDLRR